MFLTSPKNNLDFDMRGLLGEGYLGKELGVSGADIAVLRKRYTE